MSNMYDKPMHYSHLISRPIGLSQVQAELDRDIREGLANTLVPVPVGLDPLNDLLCGGFHAEDLVLLGGIQGVGKTVAILQMARSFALNNRLAIIVCYEHSRRHIFFRMLCMESWWNQGPKLTWPELRQAIVQMGSNPERCFDELLLRLPAAREAWNRMARYMDGIWITQGDGVYFNTEELRKCVHNAVVAGYRSPILLVDYAQKVPIRRDELGFMPNDDNVRIGLVMSRLKSIALEFHCTVVAVAAADAEALRAQRVHLENLWGPSLVQYEPDTVLILNRGTADPGGEGITSVRWAIEKQRNGPQAVECEFELYGPQFAFNPQGRLVGADESFQGERVALQKALRSLRQQTLATPLDTKAEMQQRSNAHT